MTGIVRGKAAGAQRHMDCMGMLKNRAIAAAIPGMKVCDPVAKITHGAAIGSVDQQHRSHPTLAVLHGPQLQARR